MNLPFELLWAVLEEVLRVVKLFLKAFRLRLCPFLKGRLNTKVCADGSVTVLSGHGQCVNGNRVAVVEPKQDRGLKLASRGGRLRNNQAFARRFRIGFGF